MRVFQPGRRAFLIGGAMLLPGISAAALGDEAGKPERSAIRSIAAIERRLGGRVGLAVLDTASGRRIDFRSAERFPMCSTFKFLAVAAVLKRVDEGREALDRRIAYAAADLLAYAPIARQHLPEGGMSLSALCAAAIEYSDNTAANLLLQVLGGPAAVTAYALSLGDAMTRLDRIEPALNEALPGDVRDTTTPAAMLADLQNILLGQALSVDSRQMLEDWLIGNTTGGARLRAGVPQDWRVGDKTGTGKRGAAGDIAILWPPRRQPLLATAYLAGSPASLASRNTALAGLGRIIADSF